MGSPDWFISYQTKANRFNSLLGLGKNYRGLAPLGGFLPARAPALLLSYQPQRQMKCQVQPFH